MSEEIDIDAIDFTSIVQLRRALHRIGVSSSTPGLTGTKRMRELGKRVRIAAGDIVPSTKEEEEVSKLQKHRWIFESVLSCEVQLVIVKVLHERWDKMPL